MFQNFKNNEAYLQNWFDNVDDTAIITNIDTVGDDALKGTDLFHKNKYGTRLENGVELPKSPNDPFLKHQK